MGAAWGGGVRNGCASADIHAIYGLGLRPTVPYTQYLIEYDLTSLSSSESPLSSSGVGEVRTRGLSDLLRRKRRLHQQARAEAPTHPQWRGGPNS